MFVLHHLDHHFTNSYPSMCLPFATAFGYYGISRTVRKLTFLDLLLSWYVFHFYLMQSIKSCCVNLQGWFIRKYTYRASTYSTARWRCGGHRRNWGRTSHSSWTFTADVRGILALILFVRPHIAAPSPH